MIHKNLDKHNANVLALRNRDRHEGEQ
jgi:hypothetical protein